MSTITREFTKEQLIEQAKSSIERYSKAVAGFPRHMNVAMELKLARIALASLEAEAVHQVYDESGGWFDVDSSDAAGEVEDGNPIRVLYTAPPALVVPVLKVDWQENEFSAGWNACHAATLQGADGNSPVIPDGWKLVPIDPTKDMLRAGQSVVGFWLNTVHCYSKMLAAAPAAPRQEVKP